MASPTPALTPAASPGVPQEPQKLRREQTPGLGPPWVSCLDEKVPGSPGPVVQVAPQEEAWVSQAVLDPGCGHGAALGSALREMVGGEPGKGSEARQGPPVAWRRLGSRSGQSSACSFLGGPALCRQDISPSSPAVAWRSKGSRVNSGLSPVPAAWTLLDLCLLPLGRRPSVTSPQPGARPRPQILEAMPPTVPCPAHQALAALWSRSVHSACPRGPRCPAQLRVTRCPAPRPSRGAWGGG